ncbi:SIS domain-containing protein [Dasania sp. GY-MA-18]|uniref:SIS domain-containing protein n=1 Tax=Dasania phycosphaerae TaxID=2950436 RepID=A0A9J6RPA4_9GAMM|nr:MULTISPECIES: SIS domain-containing protein [Dasania]MCR8923703.1 SIS domain-containing protein [Dasania sp. GY-MA-18]MCZ0866137.1 SIS domain-containing protein [Dasania phycosphaerae]MCZ0869861.1 SIS domain-containing protein [Dasania phycosphaerae]
MMDLYEYVTELFHSHIDTSMRSMEELPMVLAECGELMAQCLLSDKKILCCGEGQSGAIAQIFASHLLNRFNHERPGLAAIALNDSTTVTAITGEGNFAEVFAKQIRALGQSGDILLVLSSGSNVTSSSQAIQAAHDRDMLVITINSNEHDSTALLLPEDIELCIPSNNRARVGETQLLIVNCLCEIIEQQLFGSEE